jgi:hypothetical protein
MKLIEAHFSWEIDATGYSNILFTSLGAAKKRARELIQFEIETNIENANRYDTEPNELYLVVEFDRVTVTKLTRESFCQIINSNGGSYVAHREPIDKIEKHWKPKGK